MLYEWGEVYVTRTQRCTYQRLGNAHSAKGMEAGGKLRKTNYRNNYRRIKTVVIPLKLLAAPPLVPRKIQP